MFALHDLTMSTQRQNPQIIKMFNLPKGIHCNTKASLDVNRKLRHIAHFWKTNGWWTPLGICTSRDYEYLREYGIIKELESAHNSGDYEYAHELYWFCTELNLMDFGTRKTRFSSRSITMPECPIWLFFVNYKKFLLKNIKFFSLLGKLIIVNSWVNLQVSQNPELCELWGHFRL